MDADALAPSVRAGSVSIELVNFGMDNHDLVIKCDEGRARSRCGSSSCPRAAGRERTLRLTPGRYALWCSLPGHKAKGMHATLLVKK